MTLTDIYLPVMAFLFTNKIFLLPKKGGIHERVLDLSAALVTFLFAALHIGNSFDWDMKSTMISVFLWIFAALTFIFLLLECFRDLRDKFTS